MKKITQQLRYGDIAKTSTFHNDPSLPIVHYAWHSLNAVLHELRTDLKGLVQADALQRLTRNGPNKIALDKLIRRVDKRTDRKLSLQQQPAVVRRRATLSAFPIEREITIRSLVAGDIITLKSGDLIPADIRLIDSESFLVDQSAPDSLPNACLMGAQVIHGTATAVVVGTGPATCLGCEAEDAVAAMLAVSATYFSLLRPARLAATAIICSGFLLSTAPAHAQEGVSLYGTVDTGIGWTRVSGGDRLTGTLSGGQTDSLWGLHGAEELANGFKANFTLESGFDPSTGSLEDEDRLFNYAAWIGIGHDELGEFRLGRQHAIGQRFGDELEIASWADFGLGALFKASDNYQLSNTISYLSPELSGFQAGLSYSFNANEGEHFQTSHNARALSAGLRYDDGPLYATLTYDRMQPGHDGVHGSRSAQAWQLGASYDFEVIKLAAGWSRQSNGFVGLNGGDTTTDDLSEIGLSGAGPMEFVQGGRVDAWFLGASLPLGPGRALAQWSIASPDWTWRSTGERAKKVQTYSLGYVYDLSPRTSVYAFAAGGRNFSLDDTFTAGNPTVSRIAAGLTHHF